MKKPTMRKSRGFTGFKKHLSWLLKMSLPLLVISSCATVEHWPENEVLYKILRFREGFGTLTNRYCKTYKDDDSCAEWGLREYALQDPNIRKMLRDMSFVCNVGGQRYKIDADSARLRRDSYEKCGFLHLKTCVSSEFRTIKDDIEYLRAANTRCFSSRIYRFDIF